MSTMKGQLVQNLSFVLSTILVDGPAEPPTPGTRSSLWLRRLYTPPSLPSLAGSDAPISFRDLRTAFESVCSNERFWRLFGRLVSSHALPHEEGVGPTLASEDPFGRARLAEFEAFCLSGDGSRHDPNGRRKKRMPQMGLNQQIPDSSSKLVDPTFLSRFKAFVGQLLLFLEYMGSSRLATGAAGVSGIATPTAEAADEIPFAGADSAPSPASPASAPQQVVPVPEELLFYLNSQYARLYRATAPQTDRPASQSLLQGLGRRRGSGGTSGPASSLPLSIGGIGSKLTSLDEALLLPKDRRPFAVSRQVPRWAAPPTSGAAMLPLTSTPSYSSVPTPSSPSSSQGGNGNGEDSTQYLALCRACGSYLPASLFYRDSLQMGLERPDLCCRECRLSSAPLQELGLSPATLIEESVTLVLCKVSSILTDLILSIIGRLHVLLTESLSVAVKSDASGTLPSLVSTLLSASSSPSASLDNVTASIIGMRPPQSVVDQILARLEIEASNGACTVLPDSGCFLWSVPAELESHPSIYAVFESTLAATISALSTSPLVLNPSSILSQMMPPPSAPAVASESSSSPLTPASIQSFVSSSSGSSSASSSASSPDSSLSGANPLSDSDAASQFSYASSSPQMPSASSPTSSASSYNSHGYPHNQLGGGINLSALGMTGINSLDPSKRLPFKPKPNNRKGSFGVIPGPLPSRPGVLECASFAQSGVCKFGVLCRFNHTPSAHQSMPSSMPSYDHPHHAHGMDQSAMAAATAAAAMAAAAQGLQIPPHLLASIIQQQFLKQQQQNQQQQQQQQFLQALAAAAAASAASSSGPPGAAPSAQFDPMVMQAAHQFFQQQQQQHQQQQHMNAIAAAAAAASRSGPGPAAPSPLMGVRRPSVDESYGHQHQQQQPHIVGGRQQLARPTAISLPPSSSLSRPSLPSSAPPMSSSASISPMNSSPPGMPSSAPSSSSASSAPFDHASLLHSLRTGIPPGAPSPRSAPSQQQVQAMERVDALMDLLKRAQIEDSQTRLVDEHEYQNAFQEYMIQQNALAQYIEKQKESIATGVPAAHVELPVEVSRLLHQQSERERERQQYPALPPQPQHQQQQQQPPPHHYMQPSHQHQHMMMQQQQQQQHPLLGQRSVEKEQPVSTPPSSAGSASSSSSSSLLGFGGLFGSQVVQNSKPFYPASSGGGSAPGSAPNSAAPQRPGGQPNQPQPYASLYGFGTPGVWGSSAPPPSTSPSAEDFEADLSQLSLASNDYHGNDFESPVIHSAGRMGAQNHSAGDKW